MGILEKYTVPSMAKGKEIAKGEPSPSIASLETKIVAIKNELDFYEKLLIWLVLGCREEQRLPLENLRATVSKLRRPGFSTVLKRLERLQYEATYGVPRRDLSADLADLQHYFDRITADFEAIKTDIQRRFGEVIHVAIW